MPRNVQKNMRKSQVEVYEEGASDFLTPEFWGVQSQEFSEFLKDPLGLPAVTRPQIQPRKEHHLWKDGIRQSGLFDSSLSSAACSNQANEISRAETYGLGTIKLDAGKVSQLRPILSQGALTPAASRILTREDFRVSLRRAASVPPDLEGVGQNYVANQRVGAKIPARLSGRASPILSSLMKDTGGTTWQCAWRNLFSSRQNSKDDMHVSNPVRESHSTSLVIRNPCRRDLALGGISVSNKSIGPFECDASLSHAYKYERDVLSFQMMIRALMTQQRFFDATAKLFNLRIVRRLAVASDDESAITLVEIYDEACQTLETAIKRNPLQGSEKRLNESLVAIREHRSFYIEFRSKFVRRPQSVLETALSVRTRYPTVAASAVELIRKCEKMTYELLEEYQAVMLHNIQSVVGSIKLAKIKAEIREIWLDGALTNANSPHGIATKYRLLISFICLRLLQVRDVLSSTGIPVEGWVLKELIREDAGIYPSNFDQEVAKQAIQEAQKALSGLEKETEQAMQEKNARNKKSMDQHKASQDQESELSEIRQSKKEKELAIIKKAADDVRQMRDAFCEEIWRSDCGGSLDGKHGGAVTICGSLVIGSSNDSAIDIVDMDTVMFRNFTRRFTLRGHSNKVLSLVTCGTKLLFSGSMDCTIRLWSLENMKCLQVLEGHKNAVSCLAVAMEDSEWDDLQGKYLCSGSFDSTIKIWNVSEDRIGTPLDDDGLPKGKLAVTDKQEVKAAVTWQCFRTLFGHGCFIHSIVAQGCTIYSGGEDGLIKVWHVESKHSVGQLEGCRNVYSLCLVQDDSSTTNKPAEKFLCCSGIEATICLWNLNNAGFVEDGLSTKDEAVQFELSPNLELNSLSKEAQSLRRKMSFVITPEGKGWLAGVLKETEDKLASASAKAAAFQFVKALQCSNNLIYSGGGENVVRIWSLDGKSCVGEISNVGGGIHDLCISNKYMAVTCYDNCVRVYTSGELQAAHFALAAEREAQFSERGGLAMAYNQERKIPRQLLPNNCVASISCGSEHGLLLDSNGFVWSWGSSGRGQVGNGKTKNVSAPVKLLAHDKALRFKSIAAGNYHSFALARSGEVWGWGDNRWGQLGFEATEEIVSKMRAKEAMLLETANLKASLSAIESEIRTLSVSSTVEDKARCAEIASTFKLETTKLANLHEAIQQSDTLINASKYILNPQLNDKLQKSRITMLCGGGYHSVFVADDGAVFTCGFGSQGQLGQDMRLMKLAPDGNKYMDIPEMIRNPFLNEGSAIKITSASAGLLHSLFLTDEGRVYTCGLDSHGQLGFGGQTNENQGGTFALPFIITSLTMYRIHSVSAGHLHSVFQTSRGQLWSSGSYLGDKGGYSGLRCISLPAIDKEHADYAEKCSASSPVNRNPLVRVTACGSRTWITTSLGNTHSLGPRRQMQGTAMEETLLRGEWIVRGADKMVSTDSVMASEGVREPGIASLGAVPTSFVSSYRNYSAPTEDNLDAPDAFFVTSESCLACVIPPL